MNKAEIDEIAGLIGPGVDPKCLAVFVRRLRYIDTGRGEDYRPVPATPFVRRKTVMDK